MPLCCVLNHQHDTLLNPIMQTGRRQQRNVPGVPCGNVLAGGRHHDRVAVHAVSRRDLLWPACPVFARRMPQVPRGNVLAGPGSHEHPDVRPLRLRQLVQPGGCDRLQPVRQGHVRRERGSWAGLQLDLRALSGRFVHGSSLYMCVYVVCMCMF